jgi:choline dehydrogenase-like flavoprotein
MLIDDGQAAGVEFTHKGRAHRARTRTRTRREVIVSTGAIATPKMLMLSGIGPKSELKEHGTPVIVDAPGVRETFRNTSARQ